MHSPFSAANHHLAIELYQREVLREAVERAIHLRWLRK
jgi:hypothetical protein